MHRSMFVFILLIFLHHTAATRHGLLQGQQKNHPQATNEPPHLLLPHLPESIEAEELIHPYYMHGGGFGAVNDLLHDTCFTEIVMKILQPKIYHHLSHGRFAQGYFSKKLGFDPSSPTFADKSKNMNRKLLPMFENSPVSAAFAILNSYAHDLGPRSIVEWDAYFNPKAIAAWKESRSQEDLEIALKTMMVAHGTVSELAGSATAAYAGVKKLPAHAMGGMEVSKWMNVFAKSLILGSHCGASNAEGSKSKYVDAALVEEAHSEQEWSMQKCVTIYQKVVQPVLFDKKQALPFAIVLDLKQPKEDPVIPLFLGAVAKYMETQNMRIDAIGTFRPFKIRYAPEAIAHYDTTTNKELFPAPKLIKFFHFAGGLQKGLHDLVVHENDHVMFNAASLLTAVNGELKYKEDVIKSIGMEVQKFQLHIGLYVQEPDMGVVAYNLISKIVNENPTIFDLGFAWGGLNGRVIDLQSQSFFASQAKGEGAQEWVKASRFGWFVHEGTYQILTIEDEINELDGSLIGEGGEEGKDNLADMVHHTHIGENRPHLPHSDRWGWNNQDTPLGRIRDDIGQHVQNIVEGAGTR